MNENADLEVLREYAAGALTGQALRDLERRLQTEPELQAELDLYLTLKASDNVRLKKQLASVAAAEQLTPLVPRRPLMRRLPFWLAIAASVALTFTALWWWRHESPTDAAQLAQTYLSTPYPPPVTVMGEADKRPAALQAAFLAYRNGDFAAAAHQLVGIAQAPDASDETLFYTGEALLQTGQFKDAIGYFNRIGPGYWREIADWRSALAFLKTGQPEQARPILERLRNSPRQSQVETLLKALK